MKQEEEQRTETQDALRMTMDMRGGNLTNSDLNLSRFDDFEKHDEGPLEGKQEELKDKSTLDESNNNSRMPLFRLSEFRGLKTKEHLGVKGQKSRE